MDMMMVMRRIAIVIVTAWKAHAKILTDVTKALVLSKRGAHLAKRKGRRWP
jgi:hypothetical protein